MPINLVVTDDHPLTLDGIERFLECEPDLNVVARCVDGAQTLRVVRKCQPDVLVLDLHLPDFDGFEILQRLSKDKSTTRVILLTGEINEDEVLEACRLGVRGVVLKEMSPHMLVQCIRKVHGGGQWLEMHSVTRALEKMIRREEAARHVASGLTSREMEIVRLVAAGLRNKEIAEKLCISEGTVKIHLHNIYEKLQVTGRIELTAVAREKEWV